MSYLVDLYRNLFSFVEGILQGIWRFDRLPMIWQGIFVRAVLLMGYALACTVLVWIFWKWFRVNSSPVLTLLCGTLMSAGEAVKAAREMTEFSHLRSVYVSLAAWYAVAVLAFLISLAVARRRFPAEMRYHKKAYRIAALGSLLGLVWIAVTAGFPEDILSSLPQGYFQVYGNGLVLLADATAILAYLLYLWEEKKHSMRLSSHWRQLSF